ncbi:glucose-6-phosphate dehydrogenase assembly protein OpcA [Deinococcus lacus]|uniref:Glucose-6-phosphate dehydrogenase assembly protein OpcA n=1 Tax=Deinococcus lacus TaxID=392561 RepID=A0ABW1YBD9_9DEIO
MSRRGQPLKLGPVRTDVRGAEAALAALWAEEGTETRAYTGNLIALTAPSHQKRVREALAGLEGRYAGRQIIGVLDGSEAVEVDAELVQQPGGLFIERLTLHAGEEQLRGAILPLLRPATVNHIWWGSDLPPGGPLLQELTEIADQVIADSLSLDIPPARHYALADLSWSRLAPWREALAQVFDRPDACAQLHRVDTLRLFYAGHNQLPARLFAAFVADTLGWPDLSRVTFEPGKCGRENGDLCGLELTGAGAGFTLAADRSGLVRQAAYWDDQSERISESHLPTLSLTEGLARLMVLPGRSGTFERAWALARRSLP